MKSDAPAGDVAQLRAVLLLAVAMTGCGGGGGAATSGAPPVVPPAETIQGMPDPIPADAKSAGAWSALADWPIIPIHVALLPDGRVVNFGTDRKSQYPANATTSFNYDIWSPSMGFGSNSHLTLENTTGTPGQTSIDFFCAAQILLPEPTTSGSSPSVLIVGGDTYPRPDLNTFYAGGNPHSALIGNDNLVTKAADMSRGRWYATVTTLLNGDMYIQGGISKSYPSGVDHPELRSSGGVFHLLTGIITGDDPVNDPEGNDANSYRFYYPRNFVAPDGRVFGYDTMGRMYYVDPYANGGTGSLTPLTAAASGTTFSGDYQGDDSTPAMFSPGRILQVGGNANNALIIDIRGGGSPLLTQTGSFSRLRKLATATLLPTGEVLITGGSEVWNELVNPSKAAEIWSPVTGTWRMGPEEAVQRLYHSTALLMLDGSVLIGGGGGPGPHSDPNDLNSPTIDNFSAEIYFPSYLFSAATSGSKSAARPAIASISADPRVGRRFTLNYSAPAGIARVTLVKTGATTHGFNMDQRFVELSFRAIAPGQLDVRVPSNPGDAPPGYYLLSVIDTDGHPSISKAVFLNTAPAPEVAADPHIANPGDRVSLAGVAIIPFDVGGGDPNGAVIFAAGNLPPGISIDASGHVSGTPGAPGSYDAVASVSDGQRTATANFVWTVI